MNTIFFPMVPRPPSNKGQTINHSQTWQTQLHDSGSVAAASLYCIRKLAEDHAHCNW